MIELHIIKSILAFACLGAQICFLIVSITAYREVTKLEREEKKFEKKLKRKLKEAKRTPRLSLWQKVLRKYYIYREMRNSYGRLV